MTLLGWLLAAVAVLAVAAGGRSRYEGMPVGVWWAEQRMFRSARQIGARLARVVAGVFLLVGSAVVLLAALGVAVAAAAVLGAAAAAWYGLRAAAGWAAPRIHPMERLDLDPLEHPADQYSPPPPAPRGEIDPHRPSLEA